MNTIVYFSLGFGYILLFIWSLLLSKNHSLANLTNTIMLVIIGLIYDNFIIALGRFFGEGGVLESLTYSRYLFHAFFTPTLIIFAWSISQTLDFSWAKKLAWKRTLILLTAGLILYELITSIFGLKLEPNWSNGVLTYESNEQSGLIVIVVTFVLFVFSILLIKKHRLYWPLVGVLFMLLCAVLQRWFNDFPLMNIAEFILIVSLLLTKRFVVQNEKTPISN
ncbi:hypothetical protein [Ornithinibacillus halotolerans]|uniref:Membrane-associated phospholipid phosphatase n=1 Tax=Ornithinibacillus halotolerans TaxID=1274357 RepID=A0A916RWX7_9BACI|nr:hypothetical protein [Ornithinibacillus halotolerans]GGA74331.1 hypothetical protein GCM10008025_17600 [Ornithinibacillus halotolerans]